MKTNRTIRIGAVSYLNTKPLVYQLEAFAPHARVSFDLPSRLADDLAAGQLDVALIPSVEYFHKSDYVILSDACIGCRGPVLSVKLLSRVPMRQIRSLALDEGSRTSVALVQILLDERYGIRPRLEPFSIGHRPDEMDTDAVLVIGDRAIHPGPSSFVHEWDLGDQWCKWSELPFVFAMWIARRDFADQQTEAALAAARDAGVENLRVIAATEAASYGLSVEECASYFRESLHFYLGESERQRLELFRTHALQRGFVPAESPCAQTFARG